MKRLLIALAALTAAHASPLAAQTPHVARLAAVTGKVTAPVEVEIVPLADAAPGHRRVRIVARPGVDGASLALDVRAEGGLAVAAPAQAAWTAPARAGEEVTRELDLAVTGEGELRVIVEATIKQSDDVAQTNIHSYAFNPAPGADDALTKSFVPAPATDPGGRVIVEFRARRP
ncbi:hypothetical protein [Longimicrobium sp.]|uniref:hypothetical protein n=1 Tax=Longimicrobium sp. TaxID=2029185 RepID=UPI002E33B4A2|nr:hypothetical protein [Longimicrobium sp.]HEX6038433.1 hypothetical protein [Longimicrobium sp.]